MLDQCHNIGDKIPGQIRSVLNVQSRGLPADPMAAFHASGYLDRIAAERVDGVQEPDDARTCR